MTDETASTLHCPTCYSTNFQVSKPRPEDRMQMLIFKLPVRCRKCNARIYASRTYVKSLQKAGNSELGTKTMVTAGRVAE